MINLVDYIQLGVAGIAVIVILLVVKEFLRFTKHQEDNFVSVIKNHLSESSKIATEQLKSAQNLNKAVEELLTFLRYSNGKHKKKR